MDNSTFLKQVSYIVNIDTYNRIVIIYNLHDILFSIAIISLTLTFIGYKRNELLYFLCIHILGGVNLQEIFLTNDMFPITCDNILQ